MSSAEIVLQLRQKNFRRLCLRQLKKKNWDIEAANFLKKR